MSADEPPLMRYFSSLSPNILKGSQSSVPMTSTRFRHRLFLGLESVFVDIGEIEQVDRPVLGLSPEIVEIGL